MEETYETLLEEIREAGFTGVVLWSLEKSGDRYLGCLLSNEFKAILDSTCWDYQPSILDVMKNLRNTAIKLKGQK